MEYPLNIYITAHTLISSLGFVIPENLEAIHNYRSGIRMQEAGLISDHPLLAGMIDSVELEKRAKLMQITDYTRMEQLFILAIQEVISQSGTDLREPDCALLLSTTKGNVDLLNLMEPGDESSDEIREVYIERQYWGYCKHLQEYMENAGHELDDLAPKLGLKHKMQSRTPDLGLLNVKLWNCTTFYRSIKMMKIICL